MYLLVGLGNPGTKYEKTFHNAGFMAIDELAKRLGVSINKKKCKALVGEGFVGGEKVILAKPQTFMNLSGSSVRELVTFYKIPLENVIVFYDDYDLPIGGLRIRPKGSAGTHNGMRDIVYELDTTEFARVRIGIKPDEQIVPIMDYVLSSFTPVLEKLSPVFELAARAGEMFARGEDMDKIGRECNRSGKQ